MKVEIYQLSTLPMHFLRTSSPTSNRPLAPSGSFKMHYDQHNACRAWCFMQQKNGLRNRGLWDLRGHAISGSSLAKIIEQRAIKQ
jgi:hypothetical protein